MVRLRIVKYISLIFLCVVFTGRCLAEQQPDFTGNWALKLGKRVFLALTVTPAESAGQFTGSLVMLPQFVSSKDSISFSNIKGPAIRSSIVHSVVKANCLLLTAQDPDDKGDTNFQFCITGEGHGTLKVDLPGAEPWPLTKENGPLSVATDWDSTRTYYLDDSDVSNTEMQQIHAADQKDRQLDSDKTDWVRVSKADAARRQATAKLLADGKLHTGEDFARAAFVFQHGDTPDDFLLGHTLAMVAVAHGQGDSIWIAAATLDRYLQSIHQPQIYGTRFGTKAQKYTQEPYNRSLISDSLRQFLNVQTQAAQEEQRKLFDTKGTAVGP